MPRPRNIAAAAAVIGALAGAGGAGAVQQPDPQGQWALQAPYSIQVARPGGGDTLRVQAHAEVYRGDGGLVRVESAQRSVEAPSCYEAIRRKSGAAVGHALVLRENAGQWSVSESGGRRDLKVIDTLPRCVQAAVRPLVQQMKGRL